MDHRALVNLLAKIRRTLLGGREARQHQVAEKAAAFVSVYGSRAYDEARSVARSARNAKRISEADFWSQVAVAIATEHGRSIGVSGADRYLHKM